MSAINTSDPPAPRSPAAEPDRPCLQFELLLLAIDTAQIVGTPVAAVGDLGIECISMHSKQRWIKSSRAAHVSPLAAAILMRQPATTDPIKAGEMALAADVVWLEGLQDGYTGKRPGPLGESPTKGVLYSHGYVCGVRLRVEMHQQGLYCEPRE